MKKNRHTHKVMWTNEEDEKLINAVHAYGIKNWNVIAEMIEGRSGKQCRERWACMLSPEISKEAWTPEEDKKLIKLHQQFGNHWRSIANFLPGRSRINLRNRWSLLMRHDKNRTILKQQTPSANTPVNNDAKIKANDAFEIKINQTQETNKDNLIENNYNFNHENLIQWEEWAYDHGFSAQLIDQDFITNVQENVVQWY